MQDLTEAPLVDEVASGELMKLNAEVAGQRQSIEALSGKLTAEGERLRAAHSDLAESRAEIEDWQEGHQRLQDQCWQLEEELQRLRERREAAGRLPRARAEPQQHAEELDGAEELEVPPDESPFWRNPPADPELS